MSRGSKIVENWKEGKIKGNDREETATGSSALYLSHKNFEPFQIKIVRKCKIGLISFSLFRHFDTIEKERKKLAHTHFYSLSL